MPPKAQIAAGARYPTDACRSASTVLGQSLTSRCATNTMHRTTNRTEARRTSSFSLPRFDGAVRPSPVIVRSYNRPPRSQPGPQIVMKTPWRVLRDKIDGGRMAILPTPSTTRRTPGQTQIPQGPACSCDLNTAALGLHGRLSPSTISPTVVGGPIAQWRDRR